MSHGAPVPMAMQLGLVALLSWLSATSAAQAAEPRPVTAALDWHRSSAADDCLDAGDLASGVEARLHRPVFGPRERADVIVGVRLGRRPQGSWLAQIELRTAKGQLVGTRELVTAAEHCSALDESLTLAIALMVDISADELPKPAREPAPAAPRGVPQRAAIELPPHTHAPRKPWRFSAAVLGTAALGLLPEVSPGIRVGFGAEPPAFWATELYASWWPPQRDSSGDAGARLTLATLGLYLCPLELGTESTAGAFCFGQEVGQLSVSGFGFDRNEARKRLTYDLGLRARVSQRVVGRIKLIAGVQALLPMSRDRFVASEADGTLREVFRRPIVAAAGELGVGLDFP